jgi:hypothetical protein
MARRSRRSVLKPRPPRSRAPHRPTPECAWLPPRPTPSRVVSFFTHDIAAPNGSSAGMRPVLFRRHTRSAHRRTTERASALVRLERASESRCISHATRGRVGGTQGRAGQTAMHIGHAHGPVCGVDARVRRTRTRASVTRARVIEIRTQVLLERTRVAGIRPGTPVEGMRVRGMRARTPVGRHASR